MFYSLVRSLMAFRKLQESLRERKDRAPDVRHQGPQQSPPQPGQAPLSKDPEVITVTFNKVKGSMGLSIVAAKVSGVSIVTYYS